jgi:Biotin-protein ligase, N terminal
VRFSVGRVLNTPRLILAFASAITFLALTGCGSRSSPSIQASPAGLPAAIPAAEPVLLFNGTGTSADVSAVEAVLDTLNLSYKTADSSQLDAMSEQQLAGYKLLIIPGGNSIDIGDSLSPQTTSNIRGAVQSYGLHYLGLCAGAFFGGSSIYNGVDLTGGVWFNFYAAEFTGIHEEPVEISLPNSSTLDVYWQDGPQLSGWGEIVAKFPDGTPAVVEGQSGKGFVILTGVHPEAPASWRGSMIFTTSEATDLAYAGTIFQAALSGTPLAHF